jgi:hypothetical protein
MNRVLSVGSLFAGIGGIEKGLEDTGGFKTVWQVELDDYARRVLAKHWPDVRRWDDVRTFPPEGDWSCDLICGGFPCKEVSVANQYEHAAQGSRVQIADSGLSIDEWFLSYDHDTSSWRTRQRSLLEGLDEFSGTWPDYGTMRNGLAYRLDCLVPPIDATAFLCLPGRPVVVSGESLQMGVDPFIGGWSTSTGTRWTL